MKMELNYTLLLEKISECQGLGMEWGEMPLIINTDLTTYIHAFITYEDDDYLVIIVPDKTGAEYAKILNKNTVLSVEIIYSQMLEQSESIEGDVNYG